MEVLALEFVCMFEIKRHFLNETFLLKFVCFLCIRKSCSFGPLLIGSFYPRLVCLEITISHQYPHISGSEAPILPNQM